MRQLTREEHNARAMLLGMAYDLRSHTYYSADLIRPMDDLDADTLVPVPYAEITARYRALNMAAPINWSRYPGGK